MSFYPLLYWFFLFIVIQNLKLVRSEDEEEETNEKDEETTTVKPTNDKNKKIEETKKSVEKEKKNTPTVTKEDEEESEDSSGKKTEKTSEKDSEDSSDKENKETSGKDEDKSSDKDNEEPSDKENKETSGKDEDKSSDKDSEEPLDKENKESSDKDTEDPSGTEDKETSRNKPSDKHSKDSSVKKDEEDTEDRDTDSEDDEKPTTLKIPATTATKTVVNTTKSVKTHTNITSKPTLKNTDPKKIENLAKARALMCQRENFTDGASCCKSWPALTYTSQLKECLKGLDTVRVTNYFQQFILNQHLDEMSPLVMQIVKDTKLKGPMEFVACIFRTNNLMDAEQHINILQVAKTFSKGLAKEWRTILVQAMTSCSRTYPDSCPTNQAKKALSKLCALAHPLLLMQCVRRYMFLSCPPINVSPYTNESRICNKTMTILSMCDIFKDSAKNSKEANKNGTVYATTKAVVPGAVVTISTSQDTKPDNFTTKLTKKEKSTSVENATQKERVNSANTTQKETANSANTNAKQKETLNFANKSVIQKEKTNSRKDITNSTQKELTHSVNVIKNSTQGDKTNSTDVIHTNSTQKASSTSDTVKNNKLAPSSAPMMLEPAITSKPLVVVVVITPKLPVLTTLSNKAMKPGDTNSASSKQTIPKESSKSSVNSASKTSELLQEPSCALNCPVQPCVTDQRIFTKNGSRIKLPPNIGIFRTVCQKTYFFSAYKANFTLAQKECCKIGMQLIGIQSGVTQTCIEQAVTDNSEIWTSGCVASIKQSVWCSSSEILARDVRWEVPQQRTPGKCLAQKIASKGNQMQGLAEKTCSSGLLFVCEEKPTATITNPPMVKQSKAPTVPVADSKRSNNKVASVPITTRQKSKSKVTG